MIPNESANTTGTLETLFFMVILGIAAIAVALRFVQWGREAQRERTEEEQGKMDQAAKEMKAKERARDEFLKSSEDAAVLYEQYKPMLSAKGSGAYPAVQDASRALLGILTRKISADEATEYAGRTRLLVALQPAYLSAVRAEVVASEQGEGWDNEWRPEVERALRQVLDLDNEARTLDLWEKRAYATQIRNEQEARLSQLERITGQVEEGQISPLEGRLLVSDVLRGTQMLLQDMAFRVQSPDALVDDPENAEDPVLRSYLERSPEHSMWVRLWARQK